MNMEYKYYVAFFTGDFNSIKYVTSIDKENKIWRAENGKAALSMSKKQAEELCFGMACNLMSALVVQLPDTYIFIPMNKPDKGERVDDF